MNSRFTFFLAAVLGLSTGVAAQAQTQLSEAATHGKATFEANCTVCHNADSEEKKIGPGLKGLYARGTMTDGTKVTDETVTQRINEGKMPMPGFKDSLSATEIKELVEYLKTL